MHFVRMISEVLYLLAHIITCKRKYSVTNDIITDRISEGGNAIASARPSVRPSVRLPERPFVSTLSSEPIDR